MGEVPSNSMTFDLIMLKRIVEVFGVLPRNISSVSHLQSLQRGGDLLAFKVPTGVRHYEQILGAPIVIHNKFGLKSFC